MYKRILLWVIITLNEPLEWGKNYKGRNIHVNTSPQEMETFTKKL